MIAIIAALALGADPIYSPGLVAEIAARHAATLPEPLRPYAVYYTDYDHPPDDQVACRLVGNLVVNSLSRRGALHFPEPLAGPGPSYRVYYLDTLALSPHLPPEEFAPLRGWAAAAKEEAILTPDTCGIHHTTLVSLTGNPRPIVRLGTLLRYAMDGAAYDLFHEFGPTKQDVYKSLGIDDTRRDARKAVGVLQSLVGNGKKRVIVRRSGLFGEAWETMDFVEHRDEKQDPIRTLDLDKLEEAGGEIIYRLPNGLFGFLLVDGKGNRIQAGPPEVVSHYASPSKDPTIYNARSCLDCHSDGYRIPPENFIRSAIRDGLYLNDLGVEGIQQVIDDYLSLGEDVLVVDNIGYQRVAYRLVEPVGKFEDASLTPETAAAKLSLSVSTVARHYYAPVTPEQACVELGVSMERFQLLAKASLEGNFHLLAKGEKIDRTAWEGVSKTVVLREE